MNLTYKILSGLYLGNRKVSGGTLVRGCRCATSWCDLDLIFDLYITDAALKVSRYWYCFSTSISHGVEICLPRLWGTGISDAIFCILVISEMLHCSGGAVNKLN